MVSRGVGGAIMTPKFASSVSISARGVASVGGAGPPRALAPVPRSTTPSVRPAMRAVCVSLLELAMQDELLAERHGSLVPGLVAQARIALGDPGHRRD